MLEAIASILKQKCRIDANRAILLAVSGGADSLCLMDILYRLRVPVIVAHFDHRLRPESQADARQVEEFARQRKLEFLLGGGEVGNYAEVNHLSLEDAARVLRYQFLFEQAKLRGTQAVAVAHTADDQVETLLMHLLRGTGLQGLKGMSWWTLPNAWSTSMPLIRPLIGAWRSEVETYLQERKLEPILDRSNLDTTFFRNRIRHELIPELETIQPEVKRSLWRTSQILSADDQVLEDRVIQAWEACRVEVHAEDVSFQREALLAQPLAIQRRLVRRLLAHVKPGLQNIDFEAIQRVLDFAHKPTRSKNRDLAAHLQLTLQAERVWILPLGSEPPPEDWPQATLREEMELPLPGFVSLGGGWKLVAEEVEIDTQIYTTILTNTDPYQAWLDQAKVSLPLQVRPIKKGDQFAPLGLEGKVLDLWDWMAKIKLPRRGRRSWPLVISGGVVAWVSGWRLAEGFRVREETRSAIHLRLKKL